MEFKIPYSTWRKVIQNKSYATFHVVAASKRVVWAGSPDFMYRAEVESGDVNDWRTTFEAKSIRAVSDDEARACIIGLTPPTVQRTSDYKEKVSLWPAEGGKKTFFSHNWTDPTTWYQQATRVVDEVATDSGDLTTYNLVNTNVIDLYHGKITQEDFTLDGSGNSYRATVKINDVAKTEQDPHVGTGGDYTINYAAGTVTFLTALIGSDVVKVTYHYAGSSVWTLKPDAGKILKIVRAEVQFSKDIVLADSIKFQAFAGGAPVGDPDVYKTIGDFYNDANGAYPTLPALGGSSWRGYNYEVVCFPWVYQTVTDINAAQGVDVRVWLEHDIPFVGFSATATFYTLSVDAL